MMSSITKSAFLAAVCLMGAAAFTAASQAGSMNALTPNAIEAIGSNALVSPAGEAGMAGMAGMALNRIRIDGTTLKPVPVDVWAKDTNPPEPD